MSSAGLGYDLSSTTFSPEGRVFQVEYASKSVDTARTCIGIQARNGVVLASECLLQSPLVVSGAGKRISTVDNHLGLVFSGWKADGGRLVNRAREEARNYTQFLGQPIPSNVLAERLALFVQAHTLYSSVRPFGVGLILAGKDSEGYALYRVDPSGQCVKCYGCVVGREQQTIKTELEKLDTDKMDVVDAVKQAVRILYMTKEASADKKIEVHASWICEASNNEHQAVPADILRDAEDHARTLGEMND